MSGVRDVIAREVARRAGLDAAASVGLVERVGASPMPVIAALLIEGHKADDVILAVCAVTGLAPAPRLLLRKPRIPSGVDVIGVRDAGGTPIGTVQGRTWVAFSDPEAARAAMFSDDVVVCIATDADLRAARQLFEQALPAAGPVATMDIRAAAPTTKPAVTRPPHVALPELRPVEDTVRGALVEDTVQADSQVETIVAAPAERTAVTPAPLGRQEMPPVDVEREPCSGSRGWAGSSASASTGSSAPAAWRRSISPTTRRGETDEVVKGPLADPQAFAGSDPLEVPTIAGDETSDRSEVLAGATRDIEALAAGFDDDLHPPPRPPAAASVLPPPPPSSAGPPTTSASPTATTPPAPPPVTPRGGGLRSAVTGFSVVLLAGAVLLAVRWLLR